MRRLMGLGVAGVLLSLAGTGQAQAATTIGSSLTATPNTTLSCPGSCTFSQRTLPGRQVTSPIDGVVVRWRIRTATPMTVAQPIALRVIRGTGPASTGVGTSQPGAVPATSGIHTFETRLPIQSGDFIGINCCNSGLTAFSGAAGASMDNWSPPLGDGETRSPDGPNPNFQLLVNADIEPDADRDGYGDETQDGCPTDPTAQGVCPDRAAPETTINSGPIKTDSRKVAFGFLSSEPGSTFACKLTGKKVRKAALKQYGPCTSKRKYKRLKPGRYRFFVYATDAAGNPDPTPAKQKFKIVKDL